jgi:DNA processing protein
MITELGPVTVRNLAERLGAVEAVLEAGEAELVQAKGVGPERAKAIIRQRDELDVDAEIRAAKSHGARIITPVDDEYPPALKTIHDPPLALYVVGEILPQDKHAVALIGSRRCTVYGRQVADRLAFQLAKIGYTVVSGLARGIDTAAHEGALKGKGRTLAVLGGAIDCLYPAENEELAKRIARKKGAVISEYPLGREPDRTTFPYRNRIVSGISQGVVVVEASRNSGSLITVDAALEHGRAVFAVPGRIDSPYAQGCHMLIKNGARLVENVDDIVEEFEMLIPPEKKQQAETMKKRPDVQLTADEERVVRSLGHGQLDIDELSREAGLKSHVVASLLLGLEMKRVVRMLPGRKVELAVKADEIAAG